MHCGPPNHNFGSAIANNLDHINSVDGYDDDADADDDDVYTVDMDDTMSEEMKLSTSVETEVHDSTHDVDAVQPPYHHVDHVDRVTSGPHTDRAAADEGRGPETVNSPPGGAPSPPSPPPRQGEQRQQQPRSTTKCRVIPIVVSGQSTARLGQLCYETAETSGSRP